MRRQRNLLGPQAMGGMVSLWGASSLIKSIQRGTIVIAAASASNTATIAAVATENTVVRWLGISYDTDGAVDERSAWAYLSLTNATTVTATRGATTGAATVSYEVTEFLPGVIRSVQRGTIFMSAAASNTATITSVDTAKSMAYYNGTQSGDGFGYSSRYLIRVVLTNATTVTATRGNATNNMTMAYQVTEFF